MWILKTDPDHYSIDDLMREGQTVWDGVTNNAALKQIRSMKKGDRAAIYHTGGERAAVGMATVTTPPHPDPALDDAKLVVVDIKFKKRFKTPVPLSAFKGEPEFAESPLVRQSRLSIVPVDAAMWEWMLEKAEG